MGTARGELRERPRQEQAVPHRSRGARQQRLQRRHAAGLVLRLRHDRRRAVDGPESVGRDPAARGAVYAGVVYEEVARRVLRSACVGVRGALGLGESWDGVTLRRAC
jgi:hypothetical protein